MEGGYGFLLDLALILLSTKLLGLLTQRFQLPQVVGALLAGLILGPAVLNVIQETEFIKDTAEIGVIVMMFCAGMETDVNELKHSGKAAFIIALIGVLVPIGGGFALAYFFNQPGVIESDATTPVFLQNMFIGVILTATSVCISVETVKELGKDIDMQAAAMNPSFLDKSDVDEATLAKEKEILLVQALEENKNAAKPKPEQIIHKMVEGRIGKYYEENCLLQQAFVKENKVSVEKHIEAVAKELGGEIKLVKCVRFEKGEGIEKKQDDFAAEVASMAK